MLVEINGFDVTDYIDHPSLSGSKSTSDPLETMTLEFTDVGSQAMYTVGQPITVWDDFTPSTTVGVPTRNYVVNQLIAVQNSTTPYGPWAVGGALSGVLAFNAANGYGMKATFNNTTYSGGNNTAYIQQIIGYSFFANIVAGQTYMASTTVQGSGTISNIQAYLTLQYLDSTQSPLGSPVTASITPTTSLRKFSVAGVAPSGTYYVQVSVGAKATVSGNNSGSILFTQDTSSNTANVCVEPVLFAGQHLADSTPITYPTPDCTTTNDDVAILPDGTTTRLRWIFNGYIKHLKVPEREGTNRILVLDCAPLGDVIDNGAIINAAYENTTDQNILNDLVSTYYSTTLSTGQPNFTLPPNTVQFGQNISNVVYADSTLRDVLNSLADSTGFIYYVSQYNYLYYNDTPFDYSLYQVNADSPDYVTSFPPQKFTVEYDGSQLRNSVKVLGGQYYTVSTDVFSGTGSQKDFTLTSPPQNLQSITIGGTLYAPTSSNKIGVVGQDTNGVNGYVVLYDKNSSVVHFYTAPASGSNNILITYPTYRNVAVQIENNASIGQYQRRFYSKVTDTSIADSTTAQIRGISEVSAYAFPLVILTFDLNVYIERGLAVLVTSAIDGFAAQAFVIQQVGVKSLGGGVNVFSYTAGQYRPSMTDAARNTYKALQGTGSGNGSTVVQLTVESLSESTFYGDSLSAVTGTGVVATYGGTGVYYGFSSFN